MVFILLPLLLDALPAFEFKGFFQVFFREMNRIGMAFFILHQPIIMTAMPKHFPSITPKDLNGINSITANWFIAWWYVFIFADLAYPLWFMIQPLEKCLDFFVNIKQAYENQKKFGGLGLGVAGYKQRLRRGPRVLPDAFGQPYRAWRPSTSRGSPPLQRSIPQRGPSIFSSLLGDQIQRWQIQLKRDVSKNMSRYIAK
ncbi:Hypothetical_protein [Hexamita inflata]|uniref:Hypothetical_protein n=1 Tax=Hexamita inflata TaxID=28002 RepID=A0AA86UB37_9EUKA|nr:Hypothetical protein HINF_LOCUS31952 [Hexamita inflata]